VEDAGSAGEELQHQQPADQPDEPSPVARDPADVALVPDSLVHPLDGAGEAGSREERDRQTDEAGVGLDLADVDVGVHDPGAFPAEPGDIAELLQATGGEVGEEGGDHHEHRHQGEHSLGSDEHAPVDEFDSDEAADQVAEERDRLDPSPELLSTGAQPGRTPLPALADIHGPSFGVPTIAIEPAGPQ